MSILVFFFKEEKLEIIIKDTPRQINMQIILTSLFFVAVGLILLYVSQFLNNWQLTNLNGTGRISIYEVSLLWIVLSFCMTIFFSVKHLFIYYLKVN